MILLDDISKISMKEILNLYRKYVGAGYTKILSSLSFGRDIFVKAEGMYIYTNTNKKILDFTGGSGVLNHGHNHPDILKARIDFQNRKNMEVHKIVFSPYTAVLSHNIAELLPADLNKCFFPNSGAESVEGALKLAYRYHKGKRDYVMHSDIAFHGKLIASGSLGTSYPDNEGFQKIPYTQSFRYDDIDSVKDRLKVLTKKGKCNVYAIIIEPFSAGHSTACSEEFLYQLRKICDDNKIVLIFDEIFSGWSKTGYLFYFMKYEELYPDILTMSKSLGGGKSSISCYVTRDRVFNKAYGSVKDSTKHSSTYSGFGEETITAIEAVRIVVEEDYASRAKKIDQHLTPRLEKLKDKYPDSIKEIRGEGTLKCIVITTPFSTVGKLIQSIPFEAMKNQSEMIGKIVGAAIIDELYNSHDILMEATCRRIPLKNGDGFELGVYLMICPSCIADESHIDEFISGLDKTLERGMINLVRRFVENNVKSIFK